MKIKCNVTYRELLNGNSSDELDDDYVVMLENNLADNTVEELFEKQLHYLDCTRYDSTGTFRLMQTVGVPYRVEMLKAIYLVNTYCGEDYEHYHKLIERHHLNLLFEEKNPPVIYKDKKSKTVKEKKEKTTKTKTPRKSKQEKKEDKLKFKFASINIPKIKL